MLKLQEEIDNLKAIFGDYQPREIILLNLIESLIKQLEEHKETIQKLTDEINRLKGEQGKPEFNAKVSNRNISSEKERGKSEPPKQRKKKEK